MASPNIASISSVLSQCGFDETECAQIMDTLFLRLEQSTREPPNDITATQVFLHCVGETINRLSLDRKDDLDMWPIWRAFGPQSGSLVTALLSA
jgi:hypothetical protein